MLMLSDEKNVEQKDAEIEQMLRELNVSKNWIQENQREIDVLRSEQIHSVKDVARVSGKFIDNLVNHVEAVSLVAVKRRLICKVKGSRCSA